MWKRFNSALNTGGNESFLKNQDTSFNHTMNRISSNGAPSLLATKKLTI